MKPIIVRFDPHAQPALLPSLIECYREVFSDVPWNEWKQCPVCKKYWGKKDLPLILSWRSHHCGQLLVDFWPPEHVKKEIYDRITPEASSYILALSDEKVIGFTWGFPATFDFAEEDLSIGIRDPFFKEFGAYPDQIAFQNEIGVDIAYRRQGWAKKLFYARLQDFLARGLTHGIVRTRQFPEPSVTFTWFTKDFGYKIIARYPGDDGRVILAQSFDAIPPEA